MNKIRFGILGSGFMGRTHTNGYKRVGDFFPELEYRPELTAVCSRTKEKVQAFADQWGYQSIETDWKALIARDDIDAIDICTPNDMHAQIAIAAAAAIIWSQSSTEVASGFSTRTCLPSLRASTVAAGCR